MYLRLQYYQGIIKCYTVMEQLSKAEALIRERLEVEPDNPELWCSLAELKDDDEVCCVCRPRRISLLVGVSCACGRRPDVPQGVGCVGQAVHQGLSSVGPAHAGPRAGVRSFQSSSVVRQPTCSCVRISSRNAFRSSKRPFRSTSCSRPRGSTSASLPCNWRCGRRRAPLSCRWCTRTRRCVFWLPCVCDLLDSHGVPVRRRRARRGTTSAPCAQR